MRTIGKKILGVCAAIFTILTAGAQVSTLYTFSSFQGTYTAITGGTVFNTSTFDDEDIVDPVIAPITNPAIGAGLPIGFNFIFDNIVYDRLGISNNGYISLGNSAQGASAVNTNILDWNHPISTSSGASAAQQHKICPFATDLFGKTGSEIRVQTLGSAPTRTCVVQWANYQRFNQFPTGNDNINFQVCLYETSNIVDAVYGTIYSVTEDSIAEVGLRGGSNADYNNRIVNSSNLWPASLPGTSNLSSCRYNATIFPPSGLTYRWSTPQCSGTLAAVSATAASPGICPGSTFSVGLEPAYPFAGVSYTWSSSTGSSTGPYTVMPNPGTATQNPLSITAPTWYQLSATCIHNGSTVTSTPFNVTVAIPPTIGAVASSASLCSGSSLTLDVTGSSVTHTWTGGYTSGVGFPVLNTATYTVIGSSAEQCTSVATVSVLVAQTPTQGITTSPFYVCEGSTATLTSPGATNYTWTSATQTVFTSSLTFTPASAGTTTYSVTKENSGCMDTKTISVITYSLPSVFAIVAPTLVCALNSATLAVGGGQTYTWTSPGNPPSVPSFTFGGPSPVVFPPVPTTYTVAASDGTCVNTTTVALAVDPNPTLITTPSPSVICNGQSVNIGVTGGINYTWTATTGTFFTASITDTPNISTAYNVVGDNSYGCTSTANQVIIVNPNPTVTAVASKTLVCSGGATTLTAGGANAYAWDNAAITNTTLVNPVNTISGPVIFSVTGTYTATGCHTTKTVQVSVFVPTLTVSGNTNTCAGGLINLSAGGGTGNSYVWYVPGNPPYGFSTINTTVSAPSVFTVTAMTTSLTASCPGTKTVDIGIYYNPTITATPERTAICTKEMVVLTATGGVTYLWSNNAGGETITVNPGSTTNYTVTGTDANGCVSTGTVQVKVLGCAGIGESGLVNSGLSIYPNPNNGEFYIQANTSLDLTLVNELGQSIRTITLSGSNEYKVSVGELARGIYFITGQKDGAQINQKVVVVK